MRAPRRPAQRSRAECVQAERAGALTRMHACARPCKRAFADALRLRRPAFLPATATAAAPSLSPSPPRALSPPSSNRRSTRRFLLEWLAFLHRYIPLGLLEREATQRIGERCPQLAGARNDLELLMASPDAGDWVKISEMLLGPVPADFRFVPKHKSSESYEGAAAAGGAGADGGAGAGGGAGSKRAREDEEGDEGEAEG